jgi:hypothetical protein
MVRRAVTSTCRHPTSEFDHHEEIACATPFVLVIHTLRPTRRHRNRRLHIRVQHDRLLIQADGGIPWIVLLFI